MTARPMPPALARRRNYAGLALFSYGFRPFFLAGALWAAVAVSLWIPQYLGALALPSALAPLDWHVHEMLFGYVAAVIAGFLLTAIPNWTGQLPVTGVPLAGLAATWLAGRLAMLCSAEIGMAAAAAIDLAFLVTLAAVALREILAGKNWRNLRVVGVLGVLIAANVVFHLETMRSGAADYGVRLGIAAVIGLIMLIGGRIIPSFTHNWLVRMNPGRLPQPFGRFDAVCLGASALALALWVLLPHAAPTGALLAAAGVLQAARLARWAGHRTAADPLVLVLHVAYAFVPLGFGLVGGAILWPAAIPAGSGVHAWTAGAVGLMTLAVMSRATLGHTGQALRAAPATQIVFLLVLLAAGARIAAAFAPSMLLLQVAALAWALAFGGWALAYAPLLLRPRAPAPARAP